MITCVLKNHGFRNEVQVVAQVFFPGAKFAFLDDVADAGFSVVSEIVAGGAKGFVYENGVCRAEYLFDSTADYLNERRIVMLALFHALKTAVPTDTPWGALTGVRPSKPVREWLEAHLDEREILRRPTQTFCVSEEKSQLALSAAHAEKLIGKKICGTSGLYVSVPFCPSRCVYCSFNTSQKPASEDFLQMYLDALVAEIRSFRIDLPLSSIYIGGGTPTVLSNRQLETLLSAICENFPVSCEFTVEAGRPDTITPQNLGILKRYGVNRIAINPQTSNDRTLAAIGRNHRFADFLAAYDMARQAGFDCINVDLIAGLPGETPADMRRSMDALARLAPENITIHTLAIKRASRLNELRLTPGPEGVPEMLAISDEACRAANLRPYYLYRQKNMAARLENVGYARPGYECLYNAGMMAELQTIYGVGAGAVTKFIAGDLITRKFNPKAPDIYIRKTPVPWGNAPRT